MKTGPVQPRRGHTALPNELLARALAELTPEAFRLLVGLFYEAEFKREGSVAGPWRVGFGQVLVSYEGLAKRYVMSVDAVRRALRRFGALGVVARRAEAATPPARGSATSPATHAATSPTLVDIGEWGAFLGSLREPATPPATSPATGPATQAAPIQHRNTGTPNTEKRTSPVTRLPRRDEANAAQHPRTAALLSGLDAIGTPGAWAAKTETRKAVEDAIGAQAPETVARRVATAIQATGKPWLGHHLDVIRPLRSPHAADTELELDRTWLEALGSRRPAAEARWADVKASVRRSAYADALPRLLVEARSRVMAEFSDDIAAAGGGA